MAAAWEEFFVGRPVDPDLADETVRELNARHQVHDHRRVRCRDVKYMTSCPFRNGVAVTFETVPLDMPSRSAPTLPDYGSVEYWDNRYIDAGNRAKFEWFFPYKDVQGSLESYLRPDKSVERVLVVGCGTSALGDDLRKSGFHHITCIDFSGAAIRSMTAASSSAKVGESGQLPPIQYLQMDVRDMAGLPDNSFDVVIDKGVLDSVVCDITNSVGATAMLSEVRRVLQATTGLYFLFSTGSYATRVPYILEASGAGAWQITPVVLGQPSHVLALMLRPQTNPREDQASAAAKAQSKA